MAEIEKRQVCECFKCGNEAEMVVTCSIPDSELKKDRPEEKPAAEPRKIKGTAKCSQCGNEADLWIDY